MTPGRTLPLAIAVLALLTACKGKTESAPKAKHRDKAKAPTPESAPNATHPGKVDAEAPKAKPKAVVVDPNFVRGATVSTAGPNVITRKTIQDKGGDLWLATFSGVIRYDGKTFTNVTNKAGLKPVRAFSLLMDKANNIWLGTLGGGAYRYDGQSYTNFTTREGLAGNRVLCITQDNANNIWFGFEGAGATRYDGTTFSTFGKKDGFTDGDVSSMAQDSTGRIWFGTREGLFHFDGKSFVNFSERSGLSTGGYIPTLVDRRGHLWFGGVNGLHRYNGKTLRQLVKNPTWALMEEESTGHIWFGGEGNSMATLNRIDPRSVDVGPAPDIVRVATEKGMFFDIFKDKDGVIWVATLRGAHRLEGNAIRRQTSPAPLLPEE